MSKYAIRMVSAGFFTLSLIYSGIVFSESKPRKKPKARSSEKKTSIKRRTGEVFLGGKNLLELWHGARQAPKSGVPRWVSYQIPHKLDGHYNLMLISYNQKASQPFLKPWIKIANDLMKLHPKKLRYYKVPALSLGNQMQRGKGEPGRRVDSSIRSMQARSLTLHLNEHRFRRLLGVQSSSNVYGVLIDQRGNVYWRGKGIPSSAIILKISKILTRLRPRKKNTLHRKK